MKDPLASLLRVVLILEIVTLAAQLLVWWRWRMELIQFARTVL